MGKIQTTEDAQLTLEKIIDEAAASYGQGRAIDSLESAALPNQRKVVDALRHLRHVVYMGFYSTRDLTPVNLRHHLGEHLHMAFEILVEQIARAVVYRRLGGGAPSQEDRARSQKVVLDVLSQLPQVRASLALDVQSAYDGDPAAASIEEIIFSYPALGAITVHRLAHEFYARQVPLVPRIMSEYAHGDTGIDIHPGAVIGKNFFIDHGTGVVIGETCEIGDGVKLYQGVTLGALSIPRDQCGDLIRGAKRHPTLCDGVTIYAGATILGGETVVGEGSIVGGNVWLTESVPPGSRLHYTAPTQLLPEDDPPGKPRR